MADEQCEMCVNIARAGAGNHPRLIQEFDHSILLVGSHQLFAGYCVLVAKEHVHEPFDLPPIFWTELTRASRAIHQAFKPHKLNYGCYGNQVPHVHWHLFPRYEGDPQLKLVPWMQSASFDRHSTTDTQALQVINQVKNALR